jgi:hypothetical protein
MNLQKRWRRRTWVAALVALSFAPFARAQTEASEATEEPEAKPTVDIYGFAMLDMGYQFGSNDPNWFDVIRPTKLPSFDGEFGEDGHTYAGVRQSRLGVKANFPTDVGEIKTIFEFELFGTGVDAGQTTFRLRHAWGELGQMGAGQTWSPFMDPDVFPNSIEYWGPTGMVFFRNVQLRWMPANDNVTQLWFALERPGASADAGNYADRIEIQNIKGRFPYPDFSGRWRHTGDWGHFQAAGIVRYMKWDDTLKDQFDLSGHDWGWGVNLSSNLKLGDGVARLQAVYGEGIENYMNDAPVDVGVEPTGNPHQPVKGQALPLLGLVAFYDINWSSKASTSVGYSFIKIQNTTGQNDSDFKRGDYALVNFLYYPTKNVMFGPELQWGKRTNFRDKFSSDDLHIQFSVRYNFGHRIGE